jgi:citrate lyase subunit beta/citryl-CoA lyase
VILDLEDAVANAEKVATRAIVVEALGRPAPLPRLRARQLARHAVEPRRLRGGGRQRRGRHRAAEWWSPPPTCRTGEWLLGALEREHGGLPEGSIDLVPIIGTAAGYCNIAEIARAARRTRGWRSALATSRWTWASPGRPTKPKLLPYRSTLVAAVARGGPGAAGRHGLGVADGPRRLRPLGAAGERPWASRASCASPRPGAGGQRDSSAPPTRKLSHARRVLDAFARAERDGLAAIQVDGQFVDYPIVYRAQRLIEPRPDAITRAARPH